MTTKAAQERTRIETAKWDAYRGKIARLLGHLVGQRVMTRPDLIRVDYDHGLSAEAVAARIASAEPVGLAVHPVKAAAVADAAERARKVVAQVESGLAANGWDLRQAAPYPYGMSAWSSEYQQAKAKHSLYSSLVKHERGSGRPGDPDPVTMCPEYVERFVAQAEEMAAGQYDAFICKLVAKIGDAAEASLDIANGIWGKSYLTVTMRDGEVQVWMTQQIVNVSVLGNPYYQWPTRKVKA